MQLKKNQTNLNVTLRLGEATTISNPFYLFEFINNQTDQVYTCICTDLATEAQKAKFNTFSILEGVDDRLNSSLILGLAGQYLYNVHQQTSATNLDPNLSDGIVERGYMILEGVTDEVIYISYNPEINYVAYEQ